MRSYSAVSMRQFLILDFGFWIDRGGQSKIQNLKSCLQVGFLRGSQSRLDPVVLAPFPAFLDPAHGLQHAPAVAKQSHLAAGDLGPVDEDFGDSQAPAL